MRRAVLVGFAVLLLCSSAGLAVEQTVEAITPPGEQEIEDITPPREQVVDQVVAGIAPGGEQQVEPQVPKSGAAKTASKVGKVATGVAAGVVSLGAMAAMLMFF